jgi:hypothetical protein
VSADGLNAVVEAQNIHLMIFSMTRLTLAIAMSLRNVARDDKKTEQEFLLLFNLPALRGRVQNPLSQRNESTS